MSTRAAILRQNPDGPASGRSIIGNMIEDEYESPFTPCGAFKGPNPALDRLRQAKRPLPFNMTTQEKECIVDEYTRGSTLQQLARRYHRNTDVIHVILSEAGVLGEGVKRYADARTGKVFPTLIARSKGIAGQPTPEQWAYIAGIFDGEGSLTREANGGLHWRVAISQLDGDLLPWIQTVLQAGTISRQRKFEDGKLDQMVWRLSNSKGVFEFLLGVRNYVIVKRVRVELAIEQLSIRYGWTT